MSNSHRQHRSFKVTDVATHQTFAVETLVNKIRKNFMGRSLNEPKFNRITYNRVKTTSNAKHKKVFSLQQDNITYIKESSGKVSISPKKVSSISVVSKTFSDSDMYDFLMNKYERSEDFKEFLTWLQTRIPFTKESIYIPQIQDHQLQLLNSLKDIDFSDSATASSLPWLQIITLLGCIIPVHGDENSTVPTEDNFFSNSQFSSYFPTLTAVDEDGRPKTGIMEKIPTKFFDNTNSKVNQSIAKVFYYAFMQSNEDIDLSEIQTVDYDFNIDGTISTVYTPKNPTQVTHRDYGLLISNSNEVLEHFDMGYTVADPNLPINYPPNTPDVVKNFIQRDIHNNSDDLTFSDDVTGILTVIDFANWYQRYLSQLKNFDDDNFDSFLDYVKKTGITSLFGRKITDDLISSTYKVVRKLIKDDSPVITNNLISALTSTTDVEIDISIADAGVIQDSWDRYQVPGVSGDVAFNLLDTFMNLQYVPLVFEFKNNDVITFDDTYYAFTTDFTFNEDGTFIGTSNSTISGVIKNITSVNTLSQGISFNFDLSRFPIAQEIISIITELNANLQNGNDNADIIDQFLANINPLLSNKIGAELNSLVNIEDNINDIINNNYTKEYRDKLLLIHKAYMNCYSESKLDLISHLSGFIFDNLDSPFSIMSDVSDEITSILKDSSVILNSKYTDIVHDKQLVYSYSNILANGIFDDVTSLISIAKSIATVPILGAFKSIMTLFSDTKENIISNLSKIDNTISDIKQQISSFDFWPYDVMDKITKLDLMDAVSLLNKIYRVVGSKVLDEFSSFMSFVRTIDLQTSMDRFKVVVSGFASRLLQNIVTNIDSDVDKLNNYIENAIPEFISELPAIISNLASLAVDLSASIISYIYNFVNSLFAKMDTIDYNPTADYPIDNLEGEGLFTIKINDGSDENDAIEYIKKLNRDRDFSITVVSPQKNVAIITDSALKTIQVFSDCINGQFSRVLSFTNVSKYKGFESVARLNPKAYPESVFKELDRLAVAEETIHALSFLDRGPKWLRNLSPIHWALKAAETLVEAIGDDLVSSIQDNFTTALCNTFNVDSMSDFILNVGMSVIANNVYTSDDLFIPSGWLISHNYAGYLPHFRVIKKGSIQTLFDNIAIFSIALLIGVCVATGGAAISKAVNGIGKSLKFISKSIYNKYKNSRFKGNILKSIGSRKEDSDIASSTDINDAIDGMNVK
jgi:hypothetical protein